MILVECNINDEVKTKSFTYKERLVEFYCDMVMRKFKGELDFEIIHINLYENGTLTPIVLEADLTGIRLS